MKLHRFYHSVSIAMYALVFSFAVSDSWAQVSIPYEQYTSENGLSENVVYCIHQDKKGFLWIGTDYGLNRYDGYQFTSYYPSRTDDATLSNPSILCLYEDAAGKLWIGTNGGLHYFDPETGKVKRIQAPEVGADYAVTDIVDIGNDALLIQTNLQECMLIRMTDMQISTIPFSNKVTPYSSLVKKFGDAVYGIGTRHLEGHEEEMVLYYADRSTVKYKKIKDVVPFLQEKSIEFYARDKEGHHYVSSPDQRSFRVYNADGTMATSLAEEWLNKPMKLHVYCLEEFGQDIWIGTNHGLFIFNQVHQTLSAADLIGNSKNFIGQKEIRSILRDRHDNAWIGTFGEGLLQCQNKPSPFQHITLPEISQNQLARMIFGLYAWPANTVGIETTYGNIRLLKEGKTDRFILQSELSTEEMIRMTTGKSAAELSFFQSHIIDSIARQNLHFAPYILCLPDDTTVVETVNGFTIHYPSGRNRYDLDVNNILFDQDFIWVASYNGLHRIDRKTHEDHVFQFEKDNANSLSESTLYYIVADDQQQLWIGTKGGGLNVYNKTTGVFNHYTTADGLPDNVVYFILPDGRGNLWLTTNKGISRFNLTDKTFCNYTRKDGLLNAEFNRLGGVRTADGTIYFSGTSGIDYFKPEEVESVRTIDQVLINSIRVNQQEWSSRESSRFSYVQHNLTFSFTTNDFIRPDLIYFRYRLSKERMWTLVQGRNSISFSSLAPGSYQFEVQASYDNLHWSPGSTYDFFITTPWWKSWWFFSLLGMSIAGGFYFFFQYRINQLRRMQALRAKISRDLHDEVGSALSSIHVYSSVATKAFQKNPEATQDALQHIHENSRHVMENMSDIVWAINSGQNEGISLEKKLKNYSFDLLTPLGIKTQYAIDPEVEQKLQHIEARKNILLIVKEALNNIARYSKATETKITIELTDHLLKLQVEDNGIGFPIDHERTGNGLNNMKKRTEAMGGKFQLKTAVGKGTSISCVIPITTIRER